MLLPHSHLGIDIAPLPHNHASRGVVDIEVADAQPWEGRGILGVEWRDASAATNDASLASSTRTIGRAAAIIRFEYEYE